MSDQPTLSLPTRITTADLDALTNSVYELVAATFKDKQLANIKVAESTSTYKDVVTAAKFGAVQALLEATHGNDSLTAVYGGLNRATVREIKRHMRIRKVFVPYDNA